MNRTLNGETLPDDCPCPIAQITSVYRGEHGSMITETTQELRPVMSCPHHGHKEGAAESVEALAPATADTTGPA